VLEEFVAAGNCDEEEGVVDCAKAGAANAVANAAAVKVCFIIDLPPYVMEKAAQGNNARLCAT
jgi:hypothetical protein